MGENYLGRTGAGEGQKANVWRVVFVVFIASCAGCVHIHRGESSVLWEYGGGGGGGCLVHSLLLKRGGGEGN